MPIEISEKYQKNRELSILLAEAERRGLQLPTIRKRVDFPKDSNGYYVKQDGTRFGTSNEESIRFIESDAVLSALISGRGGSKSASGAQKALKKIEQGYSGAIFNPRFEDLKTSTWAEFKQWVPWDMVIPRQRYRGTPEWEPTQPFKLNFLSGAEVWFKGLKEPDSARGPNINWLWYDEAGNDTDGLAWQIALASVRVGQNIQAWITTTPKGRQHWIYRFFVQKDIPEDAKEAFEQASQGREFIEMFYMSIYDNKDNLHPVYFANLLVAYPTGWLREQEIYGRFVDAGGAFGDRKWFTQRDGGVLAQPPSVVSGRCRFWDLAASEKKVAGKKLTNPDETIGTLLSWKKGGTVTDKTGYEMKIIGRFFIEDQTGGFWEWKQIKREIVEVARNDGPYIPIYIEQEPAAGGKNQVAQLVEEIHKELGLHYKVEGALPKEWGDRIMAANTWFAEAAQGLWSVVYGNWTPKFFDQLDTFDGSDNVKDDTITSVSGARHKLAPIKLWSSIKFMYIGQKTEQKNI
jgi:phage terminase large subunit-like protein